jgi:hypothetical protein
LSFRCPETAIYEPWAIELSVGEERDDVPLFGPNFQVVSSRFRGYSWPGASLNPDRLPLIHMRFELAGRKLKQRGHGALSRRHCRLHEPAVECATAG